MRVAVVGAGYAGLAALWYLLQRNISADLFDEEGIGQGSSGASTGLLHPYPGKKALLSERGEEAMHASLELLEVAERAFGSSLHQPGILRLAMSPEQDEQFRLPRTSAVYWPQETVAEQLPDALKTGGLWIEKGKTIFSQRYLEGLFAACQEKGAHCIRQQIASLADLKEYDRVLLANGSGLFRYPECRDLPLKRRKGQALVCKWPAALSPLPYSLIGEGHISLTEDPALCLLGSTYEEEYDPAKALALKEKIAAFYPPARTFEVFEIRSGERVVAKTGYLPLAQRLDERHYVFSGLGSRGLLYHALYGKELAKQIE